MANPLLVAKNGGADVSLLPELANRHGCITGATGTGKTVTLQRLAEQFSAQGVGRVRRAEQGLLDLKDLRAMVQWCGDQAAELKTKYGNVSTASVGAIQRGLLTLEQQGAENLFGEPMLDIDDLLQTVDGLGVVNVLAADKLVTAPKLYSTFLLWLLAELFERLPEVGDREKPKLVFFFDEAHLLFSEAPPALLEKVEQVVRLIRSKGVGVYFVTQNPIDIPTGCSGNWATAFNTRCAPLPHAIRKRSPRWLRPCGPTPPSTSRR